MTAKTVVFDLVSEVSRRYNRQRLATMRRAFALGDNGFIHQTRSFAPDDTQIVTFEHFVAVYTEITTIDLAVVFKDRAAADNPEITIPLLGMQFFVGSGQVTLTNASDGQTGEAVILSA